jgi:hypothetical protein
MIVSKTMNMFACVRARLGVRLKGLKMYLTPKSLFEEKNTHFG